MDSIFKYDFANRKTTQYLISLELILNPKITFQIFTLKKQTAQLFTKITFDLT